MTLNVLGVLVENEEMENAILSSLSQNMVYLHCFFIM